MKKYTLLFILVQLSIVAFSQIDTNGLVGYYKFNGNLNDYSNKGNNATCGSVNYSSDSKGNALSSLSFTNSSEPVVLGKKDFDFTTNDQFTIACYVYAKSAATYATFITKSEEWMTTGYIFGLEYDGELKFNSNLSYNLSSPNKFPLSTMDTCGYCLRQRFCNVI